MSENDPDKWFNLQIDEPEVAQGNFRGTVPGVVEVSSITYMLFVDEKKDTWFVIRPRYEGVEIEDIYNGEVVIVNIGRPKEPNLHIPIPGSELPFESLDFYGIGNIKVIAA